jgi:hypothetical protein
MVAATLTVDAVDDAGGVHGSEGSVHLVPPDDISGEVVVDHRGGPRYHAIDYCCRFNSEPKPCTLCSRQCSVSALRAAHRKLEWRDAIILAVAIRTIYPSAYRFAIKLAAMRGLTEWSERRGAPRHTRSTSQTRPLPGRRAAWPHTRSRDRTVADERVRLRYVHVQYM